MRTRRGARRLAVLAAGALLLLCAVTAGTEGAVSCWHGTGGVPPGAAAAHRVRGTARGQAGPAQRAGDHDRRRPRRRPAVHAARAAPDRRPGRALHQHVLPAAAVLPGARVVPDRAVLPQPPRLVARAAVRLPGAPTTRPRCRSGSTRPATTQRSSASTSTATACSRCAPASRRCATCHRGGPTGAGPSTAASRPGSALDGGTYRYFDTTLNENGRLMPHQGVYQTTLFGQLTRDDAPRAGRLPAAVLLLDLLRRAAPRRPGRGRRPRAACGAPTARRQVFQNPARPGGSGAASTRRITHAPGYEGERDVRGQAVLHPRPAGAHRRPRSGACSRTRGSGRRHSRWSTGRWRRRCGRCGRPASCDNTYVVFTSDNGYFLGEHRMRQGKILPYEPSLRVPLMIRGPGHPRGARPAPTRSR